MEKLFKFPRIYHLPFSPGSSSDDKFISVEKMNDFFQGKEVVVTEKLDGENTTMYKDYIHSRTMNKSGGNTKSKINALHSTIKSEIPDGWRICGENIEASHSIAYDSSKENEQEGYVVRISNAISYPDKLIFSHMAKYVRKDHIKTDEHWKKNWKYNRVNNIFHVFSIWNENNISIPFKEVQEYCAMLNLVTVPILYSGLWDEKLIINCYTGKSVALL